MYTPFGILLIWYSSNGYVKILDDIPNTEYL